MSLQTFTNELQSNGITRNQKSDISGNFSLVVTLENIQKFEYIKISILFKVLLKNKISTNTTLITSHSTYIIILYCSVLNIYNKL